MATKFCFNPKDPTYRYAMTDFLAAAGFIECPAPDIPIPATLLTGAGGVLDQTAAALATKLRNKIGETPTEAQLKILSDMINGVDLKVLEAQALQKRFNPDPDTDKPPEPAINPIGAMSEPTLAAAPAASPETWKIDPETGVKTLMETKALDIREMTSIPLVEVSEPVDSYCERIFNGPLKTVDKTTILNYGLKKKKVTLDMSKTKPQLIKDLQMVELFDAAQAQG